MTLLLQDTGDSSHQFEARVLLLDGINNSDFSFAADGSSFTITNSGGLGSIGIGGGVLAGTYDGTVPLRPCGAVLQTGGATGLPWKAGKINLKATAQVPATSDTYLLASVLQYDSGGGPSSVIADLGDGRARISPPVTVPWQYNNWWVYGVQPVTAPVYGPGSTAKPFPDPVSLTTSTASSNGWITAGAKQPAEVLTQPYPIRHSLLQPCGVSPSSIDAFGIGRIASGDYAIAPNSGPFGSATRYSFAPPSTYPSGSTAILATGFQAGRVALTFGQTLASRYGLTSLTIRLLMKCRDGGTSACTDPLGNPADFPHSAQGQRFDSLRFGQNLTGSTSCTNQSPPSPRTITVGWGFEFAGGTFGAVTGYTANTFTTVACNRSYGWYQDIDCSSLLTQTPPGATNYFYIGVWPTSDVSNPIDYPSGSNTLTFPASTAQGPSWTWLDTTSAVLGGWELRTT